MEERLRAQGGVSEPRQKGIWEFVPGEETPPPSAVGPVERPESMRPGYQPSYSKVDPSQAFGIPAMWAYVDEIRRFPGYTPQAYLVRFLTPPVTLGDEQQIQMGTIGEIAMFFGIPISAFQGMTVPQAWDQVIFPLFREYEGIMNRERPPHIPGFLSFDFSPKNELAVVYYDR
jgi:hypothetical protein